MSEADSQQEPTMEEILASIRKIISEDDDEGGEKADVEKAAAEPEVEPEPEIEPQPEVEVNVEDTEVLELTEMVEEESEPEAEFEAEPEVEPEAEPESEPEIDYEDDFGVDDVDPATGGDVLMSGESSDKVMGEFNALSALLTSGYQGSGNTLEDLVRELLKPMLKSWLDENLPPIAERMVAKEIARLARTKKP